MSWGPPISDAGELRYVSPSSVKKFDDRKPEGCRRRWAFKYVLGLPDDAGPAAKAGTASHARLEHWLKTGENVLTDVERVGAHLVGPPPQSPDEVEYEIPLGDVKIAGVPVIGKIDRVNRSGRWVTPEGTEEPSPIEIQDHKFSGDPVRWAKTGTELASDLAMNVYAAGEFRHQRGLGNNPQGFRLSHVYYGLKTRIAFKRTVVVPMTSVWDVLRSHEAIVSDMRDAARVRDPNDLPMNADACYAYRQPCPYISRCDRPPEIDVRLIELRVRNPTGGANMGLSDALTGGIARLEALEKAEKAAPNQDLINLAKAARARVAELAVPAGYDGQPEITGELASLLGAPKGASLAGAGRLGRLPISTLAELHQLIRDLEAKIASSPPAQQVPQAAIVPPDAPKPSDANMAEPVPAEELPGLPPAVQQAAQQQAAAYVAAQAAAPAEPPPATKPRRGPGRPKAPAAVAPDSTAPAAPTPVPEPQVVATYTVPVTTYGPAITIYADCLPNRGQPEPLDGYVEQLCAALAANEGALHVMLAPEKLKDGRSSALAFGKWKAAIEIAARANPPAPGTYRLLRCRGDEMREAVLRGLDGTALVIWGTP